MRIIPLPSGPFLRLKNPFLLLFFILLAFPYSHAQVAFKFNALADLELSKAGEQSHYYYNEIHQDYLDTRFGVSQLNVISQVTIKTQWTLSARLLLERDKGQKLEQLKIPQLNLQWLSEKRDYGLTIGTFTNPFGGFNARQLSTERNIIGLPLAYAYYHNISDKIGFMEGMGDINKVPIDGEVQWGTTNLYYGGYAMGAMFSWNIKPSKLNWKLALVSGASNMQKRFTDPVHYGIISKLKIQPTYFWEQGFSISYGTFLQESEVSDQLDDLRAYTQTLIGTDFKVGSGFFEFSGEIIGAFYKVPHYNFGNGMFDSGGGEGALNISNLSAYLDIKYELPMIQGSYIAYRIDHLRFGNLAENDSPNWDNNVLRHSVAIGYHLNQYLLARAAVSTQQVDNKTWDKTQRTFRLVLTAHY